MLAASHSIPLSRRLVGRYLAFALGGLLLCLVTVLTLVSRGALTEWVSLAAAGPAVVLLFGALVLGQTVRRSSAIERELARLAETGNLDRASLRPLPGHDLAILGWNALLERLELQTSLVAIEERVAQKLAGFQDGQFLSVLNSLPDGIAVTDASGRITLANTVLAAFANEDNLSDLSGKDLLEAVGALSASNHADIQATFLKTNGSAACELRRGPQIDDGVWRISRHPLRTETGEPKFVWTVRDLTQQAIVHQARNEFVSTATHELRTPLANIRAYAETLVTHEAIDLEQQKEFCNIINAEATRLSRFVDAVLNVSQIESGSFAIDRHETELDRLLQNVIDHVRPQMVQKEIDFTVELPPKLPKLHLDKDKFQAALVNLLGNAAKYTPDGGVVSFRVEAKPSQLLFHVQDSGIGIAPEELPRVFEKFYRSTDPRVAMLAGNGLGLAFTQEIVRLHGGRIQVESTLDEGSQFTIQLPIPAGA